MVRAVTHVRRDSQVFKHSTVYVSANCSESPAKPEGDYTKDGGF